VRPAAAVAAVSLALVAALASGVARASPADEQLAQSLFDAGRLLMDKGDYARACPMLAESQRLDPGGGTLLNLAVCHEKEGKLGTAWLELNQALSQAIKDGRKDREQTAREHLAAIEPHLPRLLLKYAGAPPPELKIELDGAATSAAMLGVATPLDTGKHTVKVSAPGYEPFAWEGDVAAEKTTEIAVPALKPLPVTPPPPPPPPPRRDEPPRGPAPLPPPKSQRNPVVAVLLGASAGVLLVGSGVTYYLSLRAASDASDRCITDRNFCPDDDAVSAVSRARALTWVSIGLAGGAAVAGIGALTMGVVTAVSANGTAIGVAPVAGGGGAVTAVGRF
jgi:hypothetical protein